MIESKSLGAQSTLNNPQKLSNIVRWGVSHPQDSLRLSRIISYFQYSKILELGTSIGINTMYLAKNSEAHITTIEGNAQLAQVALDNFSQAKLTNINLVVSGIDQALEKMADSFDMIYIDANHTYTATLRYFEWAISHLNSNGCIVFDDINWSPGMAQAWAKISKTKNYIAIENFDLGILIHREDCNNQSFVLKF